MGFIRNLVQIFFFGFVFFLVWSELIRCSRLDITVAVCFRCILSNFTYYLYKLLTESNWTCNSDFSDAGVTISCLPKRRHNRLHLEVGIAHCTAAISSSVAQSKSSQTVLKRSSARTPCSTPYKISLNALPLLFLTVNNRGLKC